MQAASQGLAEGVRGNGVRARRQDVLSARGRGDATTVADRVGAEGMHGQGWTHQPPQEHNIGCAQSGSLVVMGTVTNQERERQEGFFFLFSSSSIYIV